MANAAVRDTAINKAIADRKIPETKREFYERMWQVDPSETLSLLTSMPKPASAAPVAAMPVAADAPGDGYVDTFLTAEERERIAHAQAGSPPPRLMTEPGGAA